MGANIAVINMMKNIKENVPNFNNRGKLDDYLVKILKKSKRQVRSHIRNGTCHIYAV